jgi:hypothetical protein
VTGPVAADNPITAPAAGFAYYSGSMVSGSALPGAPVNAGTYTVRASFAGNTNYASASADKTITIAPATPTVAITWNNSGYTGSAHPATATVTGPVAADNPITAPAVSFAYYSGSTVSGSALPGAPVNAGTYIVRASFAGNTNYAYAFADKTITIAQLTPTITWSNPANIYVGTPLSATQLNASASTAGSFVYTPAAGIVLGVGNSQTLSVTVAPSDTTNYSSNGKSVTINVLPDPTTLTWTGPVAGTYSDCAFRYQVRLNSTAGLVGPIAGQTITFTFGTTVLGTAVTDADGKATLTIPLLLPAGTNVVRASYAATANYQVASVDQAIAVLPGTAGPRPGQALYTGTTWAWTTSGTSSAASLTLSATIQDLDACTADIRTAKVTFALRNTDGTYTAIQGTTNLPVGLVNPGDTSVGTSNAIIQYNIGNSAAASLNIAVIVGGNYTFNNAASDTLVTIARPGVANTMIGGANVNLLTAPVANGYLAPAPEVLDPSVNGYMQFSSYVTYTNKGTNPQGNITVQFNSKQAPDGVTVYPVYHRYLIRSTSISSLVKVGNGVQQFNAKGVVQDLTTGASIDGGATVQVTVTDGQYANGSGSDQVGVSVYNSKNGSLWFSSGWGSNAGKPPSTQQKSIVPNSGNVVVQ